MAEGRAATRMEWKRRAEPITRQFNFFRLHVLYFTVTPLVASAILYHMTPRTEPRPEYIDCLYMCMSAITVTGLSSALIGRMSTGQQVILCALTTFGSTSFISIVTLFIRRRAFTKRMKEASSRGHGLADLGGAHRGRNADRTVSPSDVTRISPYAALPVPPVNEQDTAGGTGTTVTANASPGEPAVNEEQDQKDSLELERDVFGAVARLDGRPRRMSDPEPVLSFSSDPVGHRERTQSQRLGTHNVLRAIGSTSHREVTEHQLHRRHATSRPPPQLEPAIERSRSLATLRAESINSGFGGFPNPITATLRFVKRRIPQMERTTTFISTHSVTGVPSTPGGRVRPAPYISFNARVGRNSRFYDLTAEQKNELGGVEYRALGLLLKVVLAYWLGFQLIAVLILAPWAETTGTFAPVWSNEKWPTNPTWFIWYQVSSAFGNCGLSTVDAGMVPFQRAYLLIMVMMVLILAGNTAYPIFLRGFIWLLEKFLPRRSQTKETLRFLLDHPRRCFLYLFPQRETYFLIFFLVVIDLIDWIFFLVLDIGNPVIEAIPVGTRIIDGLFQAAAVRTAGFGIVPLGEVAPAVQVLYAVMMYISVYPIAVLIRSTNVYEEKSMGIFNEDGNEDDAKKTEGSSPLAYIGYHVRKQLAHDMYYLVFALWLVCIVERANISDDASPSISVFSILFEISSAYGTVGLSLGSGLGDTSLSGDLRPLSKLIFCAIMLRGRHRGLPIAIDRAVLLPSDLVRFHDDAVDEDAITDHVSTRQRRSSFGTVAHSEHSIG